MKLKRRWLSIILLILVLFPAQLVGAGNGLGGKFLPVSSIRPGMKGTGYTVVSGNKIEPFSVKVIGLLEGSGSVGNFILVKVSGRIFNNGGGIAAGMSGSPIFIDNQLIGAIGYGFQNADPTYGLVTPIEDMLRIWSYPGSGGNQEPLVFSGGGFEDYQGVAFTEGVGSKKDPFGLEGKESKWLQAKPVTTPLLVSGLGKRAFNQLRPALTRGTLVPIYAGLAQGARSRAGGKEEGGFKPEPGSAVSVTLVEGDYQAQALGTLTWVEQGKFLAFGHPFMNQGLVDYGFGGAEILETVASNVFPFKIGIGSSPVGRVTQDRGAGIAGEFGSIPEFIEVSVSVRGERRTKRDHYSFRVIQDEKLGPGLILAGVLDAVDRRLDRIGAGTARVKFRVEGDGFSPIERENLFYGGDIAAASLYDLNRLLVLLSGNEFSPVKLTSVSVLMDISPQRLSAKLLKTDLPKEEFYPGEEFVLEQRLLPYRAQEVKVPFRIKLPDEISPGRWMLSIHGTGYDTARKEENGEKEGEFDYWETITSLDQLIEEYLSTPANNCLVVEAFPLDQDIGMTEEAVEPESSGRESEETAEEEGESYFLPEETPETHVWTEPTKYFLTGEEQIVITVADPEAEENDTAEEEEGEDETGGEMTSEDRNGISDQTGKELADETGNVDARIRKNGHSEI